MAVKPETLTFKVNYDMQAVKDALRTERMWYLEAFKKIEPCLEWMFAESPAEDTFSALTVCRERMRALEDELNAEG